MYVLISSQRPLFYDLIISALSKICYARFQLSYLASLASISNKCVQINPAVLSDVLEQYFGLGRVLNDIPIFLRASECPLALLWKSEMTRFIEVQEGEHISHIFSAILTKVILLGMQSRFANQLVANSTSSGNIWIIRIMNQNRNFPNMKYLRPITCENTSHLEPNPSIQKGIDFEA